MIPSYLYHYTSVETLELILRNKTLRFTRLDLMNDPVEGHLGGFYDIRKYVFTSSWTAEKRDELPMWKMYSELKGIRLRMPIDLFDFAGALQVYKSESQYILKSYLNKTYEIKIDEFVHADDSPKKDIPNFKTISGPLKVEYCDNSIDLYNGIIKKSRKHKDFFEIDTSLLGQRKLDVWSFEKEYRFRAIMGDSIMIAGSQAYLSQPINVISKYVDILFNEAALNNLEILVGPQAEADTEDRLTELLKELSILGKIEKSKISVK